MLIFLNLLTLIETHGLGIQDAGGISMKNEYPPRTNLRQLVAQSPLPAIAPGTVNLDSMGGSEPREAVLVALEELNAALAVGDSQRLTACFFPEQAYWRDQLAMTYHLRTFATPAIVAASLLETKKLRGLKKSIALVGTPQFVPATPALVS